jgi:hypothetical protein
MIENFASLKPEKPLEQIIENYQSVVRNYAYDRVYKSNSRSHIIYCIVNGLAIYLSLRDLLKEVKLDALASDLDHIIYGQTLLANLGLAIHAKDKKKQEELVLKVKEYAPLGLRDTQSYYKMNANDIKSKISKEQDAKKMFIYFNTLIMYESDFIATKLKPEDHKKNDDCDEIKSFEYLSIEKEAEKIKKIYFQKIVMLLSSNLEELNRGYWETIIGDIDEPKEILKLRVTFEKEFPDEFPKRQ